MLFGSSLKVLQRWIQAVNSRNWSAVLALYNSQATLLPTFSPHVLCTAKDRRSYFQKLASRRDLAVYLHKKHLRVQLLAQGIEVVSGIYRFRFSIDDEPLVFEARFGFVVNLSENNPILHHHSSQIPRTLS